MKDVNENKAVCVVQTNFDDWENVRKTYHEKKVPSFATECSRQLAACCQKK